MNEQDDQFQQYAPHISVANIPRFGVDVNTGGLKVYLDKISVIFITIITEIIKKKKIKQGSLNQHALLINQLEKEIHNKIDMQKYSESIISMSGGLNIHDNDSLRYFYLINYIKKNNIIDDG